MTTRALAAPPARSVRDGLPAGLAGVAAPHLVALVWSLLAAAVRGPAPRVAAFLDPLASRPAGHLAAALLFTGAAGAGWSAAAMDAPTLWSPVLLLFLAVSALGFRLGARG